MVTRTGYLPISLEQVDPGRKFWSAIQASTTGNVGLLLVICAQFFFASMNLSVKLLGGLHPPTPTLQLIVIRMTITLCCCLAYMFANSVPDPFLGPKGVRGLLVARGFIGFFGLFGMYSALNYLSLADATLITYLCPFTTALGGYLILGESYTKKEALAGVCSLFGVVLIARPTFLFGNATEGDGVTNFERLRGVGSALINVGGATAAYITVRAIGTRAHPMHVLTFFSSWSVIVASVAMVATNDSPVLPLTWQWIVLILVIGLLGFASQLSLTIGLRHETATRASLSSYFQLLFAVALEFAVFGTAPSLLSVAGAVIIIAAQIRAILSKETLSDNAEVALGPLSTVDGEQIRSSGVDGSQSIEEIAEPLLDDDPV